MQHFPFFSIIGSHDFDAAKLQYGPRVWEPLLARTRGESISSLARIFCQNIHKRLLCTRKDFTRRLASETSIFRLDLSAATRMYTKKGLADTSFVIAVICVFTFQIIFHGGDLADKVRSAFKLLIGYLE